MAESTSFSRRAILFGKSVGTTCRYGQLIYRNEGHSPRYDEEGGDGPHVDLEDFERYAEVLIILGCEPSYAGIV